MKTEYIVLDSEGERSRDINATNGAESLEAFTTFRKAKKRADQLALDNPGTAIGIYELVSETAAQVGKPENHRKYPIEHYQ